MGYILFLHYVTPSFIIALILYEQRKKQIKELGVELPYETDFSKYSQGFK